MPKNDIQILDTDVLIIGSGTERGSAVTGPVSCRACHVFSIEVLNADSTR